MKWLDVTLNDIIRCNFVDLKECNVMYCYFKKLSLSEISKEASNQKNISKEGYRWFLEQHNVHLTNIETLDSYVYRNRVFKKVKGLRKTHHKRLYLSILYLFRLCGAQQQIQNCIWHIWNTSLPSISKKQLFLLVAIRAEVLLEMFQQGTKLAKWPKL